MGQCEILMRLSVTQLYRLKFDEDYCLKLHTELRGTDLFIDIDKTWQGIHYLFNDSAWEGKPPARWIIYGDAPLHKFMGDSDSIYYLRPCQVFKVNKFLSNFSEEEIKKIYNNKNFRNADIYPGIWDNHDEEEFEYLLHFYRQLKTLYQKAAEAREYVVMEIG